MTENEHIKLGQYHTMELDLQYHFTLTKANWDTIYLDRVSESSDPAKSAEIAAVVMQMGLAHVCLLTKYMTVIRARVEMSIPRKRTGSSTRHDKGIQRFFDGVAEALFKHVDLKQIKCVVIASPAFVKNDFLEYTLANAVKNNTRDVLEHKSKFILCHASSGYKHSLREVLVDPAVAAQVESTKALGEVKALDEFYRVLNSEPDRAFYGLADVTRALQANAIRTLLVTDDLFRSSDVKTRQKYVDLVDAVREAGSQVHVFSAMHVSGEQLGKLSGVAAILRFAVPDIEQQAADADAADEADEADDDDDDDDDVVPAWKTAGTSSSDSKHQTEKKADRSWDSLLQ